MGPDWKSFMEELIDHFEYNPGGEWTGNQIVRVIKDKQIEFLEKALHCMDVDEGVEI